MIEGIFLDKDVYEAEIVYMGGRVEYTGKVLFRCLRYIVEVAELCYDDYHCTVWMKRFRRGGAVISAYVYGDHVIQNGEYSQYPETNNLIDKYERAIIKKYMCLEIRFFRVVKRSLTFILQVACLVVSFLSTDKLFSEPSMRSILFTVLPILFFFLLGSFYKFYRNVDPANYKCIFPDDENDER